jgi:hypothetical protein
MVLCAGNHGGVGEAETQVGVTGEQLSHPRQSLLTAVKEKSTRLKISDEAVQDLDAQAMFDQVGYLSEDPCWYKVWAVVLLQATPHT